VPLKAFSHTFSSGRQLNVKFGEFSRASPWIASTEPLQEGKKALFQAAEQRTTEGRKKFCHKKNTKTWELGLAHHRQ
jgi:hypothetical protein